MYKTERPFRVDVHRNSLFLSSGEGRGEEGRRRGVFVFCVVQILSGKVYTSYYIHFSHM